MNPSFSFAYTTGSADAEQSGLSMRGYTAMLGIAFSGWFGTPSPSAAGGEPASQGAASGTGSESVAGDRELSGDAEGNHLSLPVIAEDRGLLTMSFSLHQTNMESKAIFSAQPNKDSHRVDLTVIRTVSIHDATKCETMVLRFDGKAVAFENVSTTLGEAGSSAQQVYIRGRIGERVLRALGLTHGRASMVVCGESWELSTAFLQKVYEFDRRFVKQLDVSEAGPGAGAANTESAAGAAKAASPAATASGAPKEGAPGQPVKTTGDSAKASDGISPAPTRMGGAGASGSGESARPSKRSR